MTPYVRYFAYAFAGYALFTGVIGCSQRRLMYHPNNNPPILAYAGLSDMAAVTLETADGLELLAWYRAPSREGAPSLIYLHGNAGHIGDRGDKVRPYLDAGYGVLLVSWRGYGGNPGSPSEEGFYDDARAALDFIEAEGVAPGRVILYGESIGGGPAVQLATERDIGALVLEAPFTSAADVAQRAYWFLPARYILLDRYESKSKIAEIDAPLFIIHGERDGVVPVDMGRSLLAAAEQPKDGRFFPSAGHNDLYDYGAAEAVLDFLRRTFP